ncbi:MAG: RluA family pseudouridine synthase [Bacteriovoracia bacterium]
MKDFQFKAQKPDERLSEALLRVTRFPVDVVNQMLACGAVQGRFRGQGPWSRVRDGRIKLHPLDQYRAHYDSKILLLPAFTDATCLTENSDYGVWVKPAGIVSQGTDAGDHCSLLYAITLKGREAFPVHRLDRETEGLMVVAYNSKAAAKLSQLFQEQKVQKTYLAIVAGDTSGLNEQGMIDMDLDRKVAQTKYKVVARLPEKRLLVELKPITGRLHQIRRHLELLGCGVWGDPKYGKGNKNREGMKLAAIGLEFFDPWDHGPRHFHYKPSFSADS